MNGSRSNNSAYGSKPSLDQLNRTIESLEARIQGLVASRQPAVRAPRPATDHVDEIIERQRALGAARQRTAAAEPQSFHSDARERIAAIRQERPQRGFETQMPASNSALTEIAATLSALRNELKNDLGASLSSDIRELRRDIHGLKSSSPSDALRQDLSRIEDRIERLAVQDRSDDLLELRDQLQSLRSMASGFARQDSLQSLEKRWDGAERLIGSIDPQGLREELVNLAWRIDGIKSELGTLGAAPAIRALEDRLISLASNVENLGSNIGSQREIEAQLNGLDMRLDEISRAIAASARQPQPSATDNIAFQRVENRLADLAAHLDSLQSSSLEREIASRIELLTRKVDELANDDAAIRMEERIDNLSRLIERNFEGAVDIADLTRRIDHLHGEQSNSLMERLDLLGARLDQMSRREDAAPTSAADQAALARLEDRLADIAERLEETANQPTPDIHALQGLETQIAMLSSLMKNGTVPAIPEDGFSDRMAAIEEYIATSDEFIVEAARQAAEAVAEAFARNGTSGRVSSHEELQALQELAEDLRTLEAHTRNSEERTQETFEALHDTLKQIAGRLDRIGENAAERTSPVVAREEPARMPRATVPSFMEEPSEMRPVRPAQAQAPAQPSMQAPLQAPMQGSSQAPSHSQVAVLQEDELENPEPEEAQGAEIGMVESETKPEKARSKSFILNLAARFKPSKKANETARVEVDPTPALDVSDLPAPVEEQNMLLEPGNGVPDVRKIMEKVRASQRAGGDPARAGSASPQDVIAAARRAAQAAAEETASQKFRQPATKGKTEAKAGSEGGKSMFAAGQTRRPILLAAAAILLVVMTYPLVSNLIKGKDQPAAEAAPAATEQVESPKTSSVDTGGGSPNVAVSTPPVTEAGQDDQATRSLPSKEMAGSSKELTGADAMLAPADASGAHPLQATTAADARPAEPAEAQPAKADASETQKQAITQTASAEDQPAVQSSGAEAAMLPANLQPAAFAEAAKAGDPLALYELAGRYSDGRNGQSLNPEEAVKWYQRAADKGFAPAEYRLGSMYEKGLGIDRDVEKARKLYLSAAEKGNANAMHNLAVVYATGASGKADFTEAARWFKAAADLNVRDSQFNLAILYARGNGVEQNLEETYKWFGVAALQGDEDAARKRDEVANALSPEKLKDAKAKLQLWKPKALDDAVNNPVVPDGWLAKSNTTASVDMKRAIRNIQAILNNNGYDAGEPDGNLGKKTVTAIKAFQKSVGLEPTGKIDEALVRELLKRNKASAQKKAG